MVRVTDEPRRGVEDHFSNALLGVRTADRPEQCKASTLLADAVLTAWE
jgi:hypothetical protein